ncbi:hypothetical protein M8A51_09240 [Schlegelella sp. S2-27]|uniref:Uncharacterized protein n=1 Tax=Caldimonas mangrovi TaxID=2944811 RepID=A0ABT0YLW3_9BURK|nr:hypothetical protein [Caldimonas mangrovi]MCM5679718.1 hypothetical protein [Caldimonas mangrovi]
MEHNGKLPCGRLHFDAYLEPEVLLSRPSSLVNKHRFFAEEARHLYAVDPAPIKAGKIHDRTAGDRFLLY